ncbi:MAG: putative CRISPR-associated protein [Endomicrobiia bacterium]
MKLIVSTSGTSIFTNNTSQEIRNLINTYTNAQENEIDSQNMERIKRHMEERKNQVLNLAQSRRYDDISKISAELNGIISYYNRNFYDDYLNNDINIIIHTDTYLGSKAAETVEELLREIGFQTVITQKIPFLNTQDITSFRRGVSELIKFCLETVAGYRANNYKVVFNLTGGFKSVQGVMQTLGMFYADEVVYIFETSNNLLRIPKLPVSLSGKDVIKNNINIFRRMIIGEEIVNINEIQNLPESFFEIDQQGNATISISGEILWNNHKKEIYREDLYDPPIRQIRFSDNFRNQVRNLSPDRKVVVNERIDDLYRYIKFNENPNALNFHRIKGNPIPPSTHEFYIWSDLGHRAYCHYENNIIVIDKIDDHL